MSRGAGRAILVVLATLVVFEFALGVMALVTLGGWVGVGILAWALAWVALNTYQIADLYGYLRHGRL